MSSPQAVLNTPSCRNLSYSTSTGLHHDHPAPDSGGVGLLDVLWLALQLPVLPRQAQHLHACVPHENYSLYEPPQDGI